ncbi:AhpA/YtjB family protein [Pseudidiomarina woesei]|uniref:Uncharacterized protein n=1 Tax=Pseudidiomarina woesei TaxID=1381080 RepID=A0A0K6HC01_9GAMM|nr:AhpA/YtjB family protein [Pseudidiomarina woesei]CUA88358.1 hypothetical protein Ga0061064_2154 [Pseudidiomarina woesei]
MKTSASHVNTLFKLVYRRGRRLLLAVLLIILIEQFWGAMHTTSLQEFQSYSHKLLNLTTEQAAAEASHWLDGNDTVNLQSLVDRLQQQDFFAYAQIFNRYGQMVAESSAKLDTDSLEQALVLVEEIKVEGQVLGYLNITVDESLVLAQPIKTHAYLTFYGQFLLGFAAIAGIFLTITFNRWRYKRLTPVK